MSKIFRVLAVAVQRTEYLRIVNDEHQCKGNEEYIYPERCPFISYVSHNILLRGNLKVKLLLLNSISQKDTKRNA